MIHLRRPKFRNTKNTGQYRTGTFYRFRKQLPLQLMVLPGILFIIVFCYIPMFGNIIAFKDYSITGGILNSPWAGFKYFSQVFSDEDFYLAMKNTIGMSSVKFLFTFIIPIFFATMLNEIPFIRFKKFVQTGSYLPHFLSYVVVATIWMVFLDPKGLVNSLLMGTGVVKSPVEFLAEPKLFWWIGTFIDCWKETGWNAIIYIAAIAGISPEQYEAAIVDGAGRLKRIRYITLPSIKNTVVVLLILNIGDLLNGGPAGSNFDQSFLLGNVFNRSTSYVIQNYIVNIGLNQMRYSFSTAVSCILSVLSLILFVVANYGSKKVADSSIF
ncbi:MAG: binding-protein-dependent transport system inner rane component [Eubacterium sp.]|nr:binding-protein-dependent transport system inner rane component [Eubacterium sp.]